MTAESTRQEKNELLLAQKIINDFGITSEKNLPVDIDRILASKGFTVKEEKLPENLTAVLDARDRKNPVLLIEKTLDIKEKRFAKAWELGQFLLDTDFEGIRTDKEIKPYVPILNNFSSEESKIAQKASNFAVELLMPQKLFAEELKKTSNSQSDLNSSKDDEILKVIAAVGGAFSVGAALVILGIALSGGRRR